MADRTLRFLLTGEDKSASKTLSTASDHAEAATKKIGGSFSKLGATIGGEFGEVLDKVGEGMEKVGEKGKKLGVGMMVGGAAVAGLGLLLDRLGDKEADATAQLQQAVTNSGNAWSDYAEEFERAAKMGENFARSTVDSKQALQTLTEATQDPEKALRDYNIALDLASVKHTSVADAARTLAQVYAGNTKAIKQFGINMTIAAGDTEAADRAIQELGRRISGQAKAEMGGLTDNIEVLRTKMADWVGEMGAKVGPAVTAVGTASMGVGAVLETGLVQKLGKTVKGWGAAGKAALTAGKDMSMGAKLGAAGSKALAVATGPVGISAVAAGVALYGLNHLMDEHARKAAHAAQQTKAFGDAIAEDNGQIGDATRKLVASQLSEVGVLSTLTSKGVTITDVLAAMQGKYDGLTSAQKDAVQGAILALNMTGKNTDALQQAIKAYQEQNEALAEGDDAQKKLAASTNATNAQLKAQSDAASTVSSAFQELNNRTLSLAQSSDDYKAKLDALSDAEKQNGKSLDENTEKGRANRAAIFSAIQSAQQFAEAQMKSGVSAADAGKKYQANIAQLRKSAEQAGLNKAEVDKLIKTYGRVPKSIQTQIDIANEAAAKRKLDMITQKRTIEVWANVHTNGGLALPNSGHVAQKASGTSYAAGGPTIVGEDGPELVNLPRGSQVVSNNRAKSALAGGGGDIYVDVHAAGSIIAQNDLIASIMSAIAQVQKTNSGRATIYTGG